MRVFLLFILLLIHSHNAKKSPLTSRRKSKRHEINDLLHKRSSTFRSVQNIPEDPYSPTKKYSLIITSDDPDAKENKKDNFVEQTFIKEKTINVLPDDKSSGHLKRDKKGSSSVINLSSWHPKKRGKNVEESGIMVLRLHEIDFDQLLRKILDKENRKYTNESDSIDHLKSEFYDKPKERKEDIQLAKSYIDQSSRQAFINSGFKFPHSIKSERVNPIKNSSQSFPENTDINLEKEIFRGKEKYQNQSVDGENTGNKKKLAETTTGPALYENKLTQLNFSSVEQKSELLNVTKTQKTNVDTVSDKDDYHFLIKQKKTSLKLFDDEKPMDQHLKHESTKHATTLLETSQLFSHDVKSTSTKSNQSDVTNGVSQKLLEDHLANEDVRNTFTLPLKSLLSFDHLKNNAPINDIGKEKMNNIKAIPKKLIGTIDNKSDGKVSSVKIKTTNANTPRFHYSVNSNIKPKVMHDHGHSPQNKTTVQKKKLKKKRQPGSSSVRPNAKTRRYFYPNFIVPSTSMYEENPIARRTLEGLKHRIEMLNLNPINKTNNQIQPHFNTSHFDFQKSVFKHPKNILREMDKNINDFYSSTRRKKLFEVSQEYDFSKPTSFDNNKSFNSPDKQTIEKGSGTDTASGSSGVERYQLELSGEDEEPNVTEHPTNKAHKTIRQNVFRDKIKQLRTLNSTYEKNNQSDISFRDKIPHPGSINYKKDTLYSVPAISELNRFGDQSLGWQDSIDQQYLDVEGLDQKEKNFVNNFLLDESAEEKNFNGNKDLSVSANSSNISSFSSRFDDGVYGDKNPNKNPDLYGLKDTASYEDVKDTAAQEDVKNNAGLYGDNKIALLQKIRKKQRERLLFLVLQNVIRKKKLERLKNLKERLLTLRRLEQSRLKQLNSPSLSHLSDQPTSSSLNDQYERMYDNILQSGFSNKGVESQDASLTKTEQQDDYLTPVIGDEINSTQKALYDRTIISGRTKSFRHQQSESKPRKIYSMFKSNLTINSANPITGNKRFHLKKKEKWLPSSDGTAELKTPIQQLLPTRYIHDESDDLLSIDESIPKKHELELPKQNIPLIKNELDNDDLKSKNNTFSPLVAGISSKEDPAKQNIQLNTLQKKEIPKNSENYFLENSSTFNLTYATNSKSIKKQELGNGSELTDQVKHKENDTQSKFIKTFDRDNSDSQDSLNLPISSFSKKPPSYLFEELNPVISAPLTFYKPTAPNIQKTGYKRQFQNFSSFSLENLSKERLSSIKNSNIGNPTISSSNNLNNDSVNYSFLNGTFYNKPLNLMTQGIYGPFEDSVSIPVERFLEKGNSRVITNISPSFNQNHDLMQQEPLRTAEMPFTSTGANSLTDMSDQTNLFYNLKLTEPHEYLPNYNGGFYTYSSVNPTNTATKSTPYTTTPPKERIMVVSTSRQQASAIVFPSPRPFMIQHHTISSLRHELETASSFSGTRPPKHSTKSLYSPTTTAFSKVDHPSQPNTNKLFSTQLHGEFMNNPQVTSSTDIDTVMNMEDMYWTDSIEEIENTCKQQKGTNSVVNILAFGDSLTRGYYNKGKSHHPYTMKLQYLLNKLDEKRCFIVENEGRDGEIAFGEMPKRMEQIFDNSRKKFDWVIILGGTNDIYNRKHAGRHSATELTQNLLSIHNIALHHNCRTVVVTVPEVFCESIEMCADMKQVRETLNENLRNYAYDHKGDVILCDLANMLGRYKNNQKLLAQFFEGGLHLKPRGYETMARLIFESLKPFFAV